MGENPSETNASAIPLGFVREAFTFDSSRTLNYCSNFIGHDHPNKPTNGGSG
jgi:hypothetical protein